MNFQTFDTDALADFLRACALRANDFTRAGLSHGDPDFDDLCDQNWDAVQEMERRLKARRKLRAQRGRELALAQRRRRENRNA